MTHLVDASDGREHRALSTIIENSSCSVVYHSSDAGGEWLVEQQVVRPFKYLHVFTGSSGC